MICMKNMGRALMILLLVTGMTGCKGSEGNDSVDSTTDSTVGDVETDVEDDTGVDVVEDTGVDAVEDTGMDVEEDTETEPDVVTGQVATPTFSPTGGDVDAGTVITITTETAGSTIWYTTGDGSQSDPTCGTGTSGTEGDSTADVAIEEDQVIKAMGCQTGWTDSTVAQDSYHILRIYVADTGNDRIVRMDDIAGTNWTTLGAEGSGTNQFHDPYDVALDSAGRIHVVDKFNNRIVRMDDMSGTNWTVLCDSPPSGCSSGMGTNQFSFPESMVFDASDRIYVADTGNHRIVRMDDMSGTNWTVLCDNPPAGCTQGSGTNQFYWPGDVAVSTGGQIYIMDTYNHRIARVDDMTGTNWTTFGSYGTEADQFNYPYGIFVDSGEHIYVADGNSGRVVSMDDMSGTNWRVYAGTDPLDYTDDVFLDSLGRIYIVDYGVDFIARMDDMVGTSWVTLGTLGTGANEFTDPQGIFVR